MKKLITSLTLYLFICSSSIWCLEVDTLVGFSGAPLNKTDIFNSASLLPSFYLPLTDNIDLVFGGYLYAPGRVDQQVATHLKFGLALDVPVFGPYTFAFNLTQGYAQNNGSDSKDIVIDGIDISRNFLYRLTDQVNIGLTIVYTRIHWNKQRGRSLELLPHIYPIIGATINI